MKRLISLLCVLALVLAFIPAVGMAAEAAKTPKYVFMFIGDGMGNPQVTATQYYEGSVQNPDATMPTASQLAYTQIPEFAREGVLADISGAVAPYLDTMTSAAKSLSQYNGQTIAVPFEVKTKVWYYRSDIFDECGIDVNSIKNTDDLIAAGKKIQETHPKCYIWNLGRTTPGYSFYLTLAGNNAKFFDELGSPGGAARVGATGSDEPRVAALPPKE